MSKYPKWWGALAISLGLAFGAASGQAQQPNKVPRIGFVTAGSRSTIAARIEAFRQGLRDLGYTEDKSIVIEWRFAQGKPDRIAELVAELVRLKVDLILSAGSAVTGPAKEATRTIPIVMAQDTDPLGNGFVASLARPGGNITGLSSYSAELNGKRVELLKELLPKLFRLAVIGQSSYPGNTSAEGNRKLSGAIEDTDQLPGHTRSKRNRDCLPRSKEGTRRRGARTAKRGPEFAP